MFMYILSISLFLTSAQALQNHSGNENEGLAFHVVVKVELAIIVINYSV